MARRPVILAVLASLAGAVLLLLAVRLAVLAHFNHQRDELLSDLAGLPADRAIATLAGCGRCCTTEEATALDFPHRPPAGRYDHFLVKEALMVRLDHRGNAVLSVEASPIEFH